MEHGNQITHEIIHELLSDIFPKNDSLESCSFTKQYNKINYKSTPSKSSNSTLIENKNYTSRKIGNTGNCCHFCGETGHIKKTCFKKQAYDKIKRVPKNSIPPSISYDSDFLRPVSKLTQIKNCKISIDEIIRIRTIVNTLIYFHPSQNNYP